MYEPLCETRWASQNYELHLSVTNGLRRQNTGYLESIARKYKAGLTSTAVGHT